MAAMFCAQVTLDTSWCPETIKTMLQGNAAVNAVLEAILAPEDKPTTESSRHQLEDFIWSKYAARRFTEDGTGVLESFPAPSGARSSTATIGTLEYSGILLCKLISGPS